ncbi:MAG: hypothetical protein ACOY0T_03465 [Myxococcota bacterium]
MCTPPAYAGNGAAIGILAATPDGAYAAVFRDNGGVVEEKFCGLAKTPPSPRPEPDFGDVETLLVRANCTNGSQVLPYAAWKWSKRTPEVNALIPFDPYDPSKASASVRIHRDRDTQLLRIELSHQGRWFPIRADESTGIAEVPLEQRYGAPETSVTTNWLSIAGLVHTNNRYLIRLQHNSSITWWDELIVIPDSIISDLPARFQAARDAAERATRAVREHRRNQTGPFRPPPKKPTGTKKYAHLQRRNTAVRQALLAWEQAHAFAPTPAAFSVTDLAQTLWLLAWLDAPTRRLEAHRLFTSFSEHDPNAARALLADLKTDPDTIPLASYLETAHDPLRNLPEVAHHTLTDAELAPLTNDQIRWLHLAQWAAQGCYRFDDPALERYFSQFPWYAPIPKRAWRIRRAQPYMKNPDAPLLRAERPAVPSGATKESLEAILRAEKARGMNPPTL